MYYFAHAFKTNQMKNDMHCGDSYIGVKFSLNFTFPSSSDTH